MRLSAEVAVCLRATLEGFVLIGLLECMSRRGLTPYYATLSHITSAKLENIVNEVLLKASIYNVFVATRRQLSLKMLWRKTCFNCSTQQYFGKNAQ
jgi:hypothetical protein